MKLAPATSWLVGLVFVTVAIPQASATEGRSAFSLGFTDDQDRDRFSYVLVRGENESLSGSGDVVDYEQVRRLKRRFDSDFLWARIDGETYVIRDRDLIQQADHYLEPVERLGRQQAKLGAQQARIGAVQARIGHQQGRLGQRQGRLGLRQVMLATRRGGDSRRELRRERLEIEAEMEQLGEEMERLGEEQARWAREQEPLARQQGRLGARQAELGKELNRNMESLVRDAVREGLADRLD